MGWHRFKYDITADMVSVYSFEFELDDNEVLTDDPYNISKAEHTIARACGSVSMVPLVEPCITGKRLSLVLWVPYIYSLPQAARVLKRELVTALRGSFLQLPRRPFKSRVVAKTVSPSIYGV